MVAWQVNADMSQTKHITEMNVTVTGLTHFKKLTMDTKCACKVGSPLRTNKKEKNRNEETARIPSKPDNIIVHNLQKLKINYDF